eukprot:341801-Pleurochrysis_carterae.AAC.1
MEITKVTDRLRTGLSTAERTGPVLFADRPFFYRVGNERGYKRRIRRHIFSATASKYDLGTNLLEEAQLPYDVCDGGRLLACILAADTALNLIANWALDFVGYRTWKLVTLAIARVTCQKGH